MLIKGSEYRKVFSFSQDDVKKFAEVTGDHNPVHLDETFAATTAFKKPILHGFLSGSIFSRILGMEFPGQGTIYMKQVMEFKRPMFASVEYEAIMTVKEADAEKHQAIISTEIFDKLSGKMTVSGEAIVINKEKI